MTARRRAAAAAIDTSVLVPAYLSAHEHHAAAAAAMLDEDVVVPAHALLEAYAVLTALPSPLRQEPRMVHQWLAEEFTGTLAYPGPGAISTLVASLAEAGLRSGAVYDGLVALAAQGGGHRLLTFDERAMTAYRVVGVEVELLG